MKSLSLSIIIVLFDIEKYANLLKPNLITFQKFISFFSSDSYLHAPLIIRCEVHPFSFYRKYEGVSLWSFWRCSQTSIFEHGNYNDRTACTAMGKRDIEAS